MEEPHEKVNIQKETALREDGWEKRPRKREPKDRQRPVGRMPSSRKTKSALRSI